jgi:hypothetical protein
LLLPSCLSSFLRSNSRDINLWACRVKDCSSRFRGLNKSSTQGPSSFVVRQAAYCCFKFLGVSYFSRVSARLNSHKRSTLWACRVKDCSSRLQELSKSSTQGPSFSVVRPGAYFCFCTQIKDLRVPVTRVKLKGLPFSPKTRFGYTGWCVD